MCGIWVADHIVICSPVGSTTVERLHEGRDQALLAVLPLEHDAVAAGLRDRLVDVAAGAGLGESDFQNADLLVPRSGWAQRSFSASAAAASFKSSAAGSSS